MNAALISQMATDWLSLRIAARLQLFTDVKKPVMQYWPSNSALFRRPNQEKTMSRFCKLITVATFTAAILGVASTAQAQDECAKYTTSYDRTYCFAKLFLESDKDLNAVYGELAKAVSQPVRIQLRDTQRTWITYRDQTCESKGTINVNCNYRVNRERAIYLRDRLTECKAGTCRNDKIAAPSWSAGLPKPN